MGYDSDLDVILEQGVQVLSADDEIFTKIKKIDDHGLKIALELERRSMSENKKRNLNIVPVYE